MPVMLPLDGWADGALSAMYLLPEKRSCARAFRLSAFSFRFSQKIANFCE